MKTALLLALYLTLNSFFALSQEEEYYDENYLRYTNHIYKENIYTVLAHRDGWVLSNPVMYLNSENGIVVSFDNLDTDIKDYSYTVEHCNANWQPSGLMRSEFIEGFTENQITDYAYSFNTMVEYVHYNVHIPNEDMKITLPGNYILKIYEDFDEKDLVITKRFFVVEDKVGIEASIKRPSQIDRRNYSHEIDFTLNTTGLNLIDPFNEIKVVIRQNNRWDNEITDLKPMYIKDNQLIYDYDVGNLFYAGSEFRFFDIKSLRYQSERIQQIEYEKPYYHVRLLDDESRRFQVYLYHQDLNGRYMPEVQEGEDDDTEADYCYVYFTLPYEAPMIDGNFYVFGSLSDWNYNARNRMTYNYEKKAYQLKMLLKQGYYNYEYIYVQDGTTLADNTFLEGSHYETENDYVIYVYHRGINDRYDKLVGLKTINSLRQ